MVSRYIPDSVPIVHTLRFLIPVFSRKKFILLKPENSFLGQRYFNSTEVNCYWDNARGTRAGTYEVCLEFFVSFSTVKALLLKMRCALLLFVVFFPLADFATNSEGIQDVPTCTSSSPGWPIAGRTHSENEGHRARGPAAVRQGALHCLSLNNGLHTARSILSVMASR